MGSHVEADKRFSRDEVTVAESAVSVEAGYVDSSGLQRNCTAWATATGRLKSSMLSVATCAAVAGDGGVDGVIAIATLVDAEHATRSSGALKKGDKQVRGRPGWFVFFVVFLCSWLSYDLLG